MRDWHKEAALIARCITSGNPLKDLDLVDFDEYLETLYEHWKLLGP